jgi:hypothetical protein
LAPDAGGAGVAGREGAGVGAPAGGAVLPDPFGAKVDGVEPADGADIVGMLLAGGRLKSDALGAAAAPHDVQPEAGAPLLAPQPLAQLPQPLVHELQPLTQVLQPLAHEPQLLGHEV